MKIFQFNFSLQTKIIILSTVFSLTIVLILGLYSSYIITTTLEKKIGENALNVAKTVASIPELKEAFKLDDPSKVIQPLAEGIREQVGAEFVVIGNKDGIRYAHPFPDRLGKRMVGGDNYGVLKEGKSYVSKAVGTLGPSLRGKTPIFDDNHNIIGVVSVGFLIEDIQAREKNYIIRILAIVVLVLIIGLAGSFFLSWNIKKDIFGLEPEEISQLFMERETLLESIREGIVAVDKDGIIKFINSTAKELIVKGTNENNLVGKRIDEVIPNTRVLEVIATGLAQYDQEMLLGDEIIITNRVPVLMSDEVVGAVSSFRKKVEIDQLLQELSDHKIYSDTLRAQNHEFINKLYTISGLLQLERYEEAIRFITDETVQQGDMIELLMSNIGDPRISAFFIGKAIRAEELKVKLDINPKTHLSSISDNNNDLITIYGNLVENSIEAVKEEEKVNRRIEVFLYETDDQICFIIEDWGPGISQEIREQIFVDGFSTRGKNRGFGLALVNTLVKKYKGSIEIIEPSHQGIIFEVKLPRNTILRGG